MSDRVASEIEVVVKMPSLTSDAVVRAMDDCSDIAECADDVLQWTIGSDLAESTITFDFVLDLDDVAAAEVRGQKLTELVLRAGTVTARSGVIVAA